MIRDRYADRPQPVSLLVTVECSICGAKRGDDYAYYSLHLATEHGPDDVGGATDV